MFVAAAPLQAASLPTLPGLGAHEQRVAVDATAWPWAAVARLQVPGGARCTAFLVAPRVALTAAHCLFSRRTGHFVPPGSVHVLVGYAHGRFAGHAVATAYRLAEGYDPRGAPPAYGADAAVLRLDRDLVAPAAALSLEAAAPVAGVPAMLGGYNRDRAEIVEADTRCAVTSLAHDAAGRTLLRHDCAGTLGTSGAPLLVRGGPRGWLVGGLQVAATAHAASGIAVPATSLRRLVAAAP